MADSQAELHKARESASQSNGQDGKTEPCLRVPEAPHRPGEEPRFSRFSQQPGDLHRPDPLVDYTELRPHANGLVRVLDDEAHASGPWNPEIDAETLLEGLKIMVRIRHFDSRMLTMQRQGRLSFYLESKMEEAVATAAGLALHPDDLLFPSYRQHALMLIRGATLLDMACQCIGNTRDNAKGRQMPVHYSWRQGKIVSISSPVGTQFPQAVGAAMAADYFGRPQVVASWLGDGTAAQGDFHYAINFASVYRPPIILNVVNNQWAISTHRNIATGGRSFAARADAYGFPGLRVDGNDFLAVYAATAWAAERARRHGGPTLLEMYTYRGGAHSTNDDPSRYRPADEGRFWPGGDPVERLKQHLIHLGAWTEEQHESLNQDTARTITEVVKEAETYGTMNEGPYDPPETIFDDVYEELPPHLKRQRDELLGEQD
ncbi:MAG: thiamine pyrophosphate-dependent dehydrogenase E1 component subunit alpha [Pirellulales bacterium]|nr:thiamine pyrophosphate-dependent dehydrogenase E1 component subunit alpha [Pirellulales bacterium]